MKSFEEALNNPTNKWRTINKLINKKSKTTNVNESNINGTSITDPSDNANSFSEYFSKVSQNLATSLEKSSTPASVFVQQPKTEFSLQPIHEDDVFKALRTMKPTKSTGYDRISPKVVRDAAEIITKLLTQIFNKFIVTGIFPDDLKIAILSPSHTSGNKIGCNNIQANLRFTYYSKSIWEGSISIAF